ncbi:MULTISPECIES: hypothetical protein [unclassified Aminobacter]|jgi:hypothetical protein|uniref:hypothetical protein n=1 Tax=unclassified Aminobacter TaxID=2644704 RepID=UPI000464665D|nr:MULTISPECIES: hypothetical protein [unclassified Aminobacter]TWH24531.1 hypothetical protein L611_006900000060 [Aminobacter sp. J15]
MSRLLASLAGLPLILGGMQAFSQESDADVRARETEQQMTDDERFSLLISVLGNVPGASVPADPRVADLENASAGWTPGVPRYSAAIWMRRWRQSG